MTNLGPQFHPNVDHYRDGGLGGVGEDHSVVGFVPTKHLLPLREYERAGKDANPQSRAVINSIRDDIRSGVGIKNPITVDYDHTSQWAYVGEGNHRLQAAIEEGVPVVPTRVVRSPYSAPRRKAEGVGGHVTHDPIPGAPEDYFPSDAHPQYLFGEKGERAPLSAHQFKQKQVDDIMDLLR